MPTLRFRTALCLIFPLLALTGCNYIHFGRLPTVINDEQLTAENSDLRLQKKMLAQELDIARREGDALRAVLEHRNAAGEEALQVAAKLRDTTRELAELRANYVKLRTERSDLVINPRVAGDGTKAILEVVTELKEKLASTEERLATTLRTYTELQDETSRLRTEVAATHAENDILTLKVKGLTEEKTEMAAAMAELNTQFLAQKEARAQAEQDSAAIRAQLETVMARTVTGAPSSLSSARESSASGAREIATPLQVANLPDDGTSTAKLATNPDRLRNPANSTPNTAPATAPGRIHMVMEGETLESIAQLYYGRPDSWVVIYAANNSKLGGGRLVKPGMRLAIPAE